MTMIAGSKAANRAERRSPLSAGSPTAPSSDLSNPPPSGGMKQAADQPPLELADPPAAAAAVCTLTVH